MMSTSPPYLLSCLPHCFRPLIRLYLHRWLYPPCNNTNDIGNDDHNSRDHNCIYDSRGFSNSRNRKPLYDSDRYDFNTKNSSMCNDGDSIMSACGGNVFRTTDTRHYDRDRNATSFTASHINPVSSSISCKLPHLRCHPTVFGLQPSSHTSHQLRICRCDPVFFTTSSSGPPPSPRPWPP